MRTLIPKRSDVPEIPRPAGDGAGLLDHSDFLVCRFGNLALPKDSYYRKVLTSEVLAIYKALQGQKPSSCTRKGDCARSLVRGR